MILSDGELKELMREGSLMVCPCTEEQIQPASIDVTLGNTYTIVDEAKHSVISPKENIAYKTVKSDSYILLPGQFVLATTREYVSLPNNLTAFVEGRSSWGRLGLFIQNAGWVDPGFEGEITLELFNANKCAIELTEGLRIGQLVFAKMERDAINPYNGKYQGQRTATGSKVYMDFRKDDNCE